MRARRAENPERQANSSIVGLSRRGLGAVGNGCIVAYGARSPTRSAAEGHAQKRRSSLPGTGCAQSNTAGYFFSNPRSSSIIRTSQGSAEASSSPIS